MKKTAVKKIICAVLCLTLIAAGLSYLTFLTERKDSYKKYRDFFDEKNDFDVLFIGTSHIMNSVYPMELWNDYGIVSYNMGGHANMIPTSYWVLKMALDYTAPKLVAVDCQGLSNILKYSDNWYFLHQSFDAFPLSLNKIRAVNDLMDMGDIEVEQRGLERPTKISLLWDYSVYHGRWQELTKDDWDPEVSVEKGAETRIGVAQPNPILKGVDEKFTGSTFGVEYLRKIIEECRARNIEVLLINVPLPASKQQLMDANAVYDIADEYNVNYVNMLAMDGIVNYDTDCYDSDSHLNPSGAHKVTDFVGRYITENYDIPDRRNDTNYASWYDDYQKYYDFKVTNLKAQQDMKNYMSLLSDKSFKYDVVQGSTEGDADFTVRDSKTNQVVDEASFVRYTRVS